MLDSWIFCFQVMKVDVDVVLGVMNFVIYYKEFMDMDEREVERD